MQATTLPQHRWLLRMLGEWKSEGEADMGPGKPKDKFESSETVTSIGEIWVQFDGTMPGDKPARTQMTLGYDPARERFVGTFIGSMMTHLWPYEGTLDAAGRVLALDSSGPSFAGDGKILPYRDEIELVDDDHRILRSFLKGPDGAWTKFMEAHYRRVK